MHTRDVRREIAEFPSRSRGRPSLKRNDKASCSFAPPITFLLTEFAGGKMIYLKRNAFLQIAPASEDEARRPRSQASACSTVMASGSD